jgi:hypothetical protein
MGQDTDYPDWGYPIFLTLLRQIGIALLPSTYFLIHYSLITLLFNAIQFEIKTTLLNENIVDTVK